MAARSGEKKAACSSSRMYFALSVPFAFSASSRWPWVALERIDSYFSLIQASSGALSTRSP